MVGVEEKGKGQDTEKPTSRKDEEGAQPIVSLTSEEPVVGDGDQEQVEESTKTVVGDENDVREDTLPTTSPTSEDRNDPTLEEPIVKQKDKDDEELIEKPTFRKDGVGEENALPTAYPTLDGPVVNDGDQKEEEYTEKQVKQEKHIQRNKGRVEVALLLLRMVLTMSVHSSTCFMAAVFVHIYEPSSKHICWYL